MELGPVVVAAGRDVRVLGRHDVRGRHGVRLPDRAGGRSPAVGAAQRRDARDGDRVRVERADRVDARPAARVLAGGVDRVARDAFVAGDGGGGGRVLVRGVFVVLPRGLGLAVGSCEWPWSVWPRCATAHRGGKGAAFRPRPCAERLRAPRGEELARAALSRVTGTGNREGRLWLLRTDSTSESLDHDRVRVSRTHLCTTPPRVFVSARSAGGRRTSVAPHEMSVARNSTESGTPTRPCHAEPRLGCSSHAAG